MINVRGPIFVAILLVIGPLSAWLYLKLMDHWERRKKNASHD